jgi:hypothetical protein
MKSDVMIGTLAEKQFLVDALKRNLLVSIPAHDHNGYDVIIQGKTKLYKVQIKATRQAEKNTGSKHCYRVNIAKGTSNKKRYSKDEVDFFAVFLVDISQWYIIPLEVCTSVNIRIHPVNTSHQFNSYLEAWHLFR